MGRCSRSTRLCGLWLKERSLAAPFRKIVVYLQEAAGFPGSTAYEPGAALNICEVAESVDGLIAKASSGDYQWLGEVVRVGLERIHARFGWSDDQLVAHVGSVACSSPPCQHRFSRFAKSHRGVACDLWFSAEPGRSAVETTFTSPDGTVERVVVLARPGPLFLEDEFPVAQAVVVGGSYILRSRERVELARLPVPA